MQEGLCKAHQKGMPQYHRKAAVHHLSDISRLDLAFQQGKEGKKKVQKPTTNSRFNNFESRSYDMSSLEAQLLNSN